MAAHGATLPLARLFATGLDSVPGQVNDRVEVGRGPSALLLRPLQAS
jgi:hypothetical protein